MKELSFLAMGIYSLWEAQGNIFDEYNKNIWSRGIEIMQLYIILIISLVMLLIVILRYNLKRYRVEESISVTWKEMWDERLRRDR
jgi:NADH:ubiquinone oxidoreductase subunit H